MGRRAGLTGSILSHVAAAALLLWLQSRPAPLATTADEPVELVFEALPVVPEPVPTAPMETVAPEPDALPPAVPEPAPPAPPAAPPDMTSPVEASPVEATPALPQLAVPQLALPEPAVSAALPPARVAPRAPTRPAPPPRMATPRAAVHTTEPAVPAAAAVAPAVPVVPAARPTAPAAVDPAWRIAMSSWLRAHQRYPEMARQRGTEGTVGITFTLARDGQVQTVAVTSSSGSPVLDDAAREMLDRQRLPAFPAEMAQLQAQVSVKIRYTLD